MATDGVKSGPIGPRFSKKVFLGLIHSPLLWLLSASSRSLRYMLYTAQILFRFNELGHSVGTKNWRRVSFWKCVQYVYIQFCAKFQHSKACVSQLTAFLKMTINSRNLYIATDGVSSGPIELKFCQKVCFMLLHNPHVGHLSASSLIFSHIVFTTLILYYLNELRHSVGTRSWQNVSFCKCV